MGMQWCAIGRVLHLVAMGWRKRIRPRCCGVSFYNSNKQPQAKSLGFIYVIQLYNNSNKQIRGRRLLSYPICKFFLELKCFYISTDLLASEVNQRGNLFQSLIKC